MGIMNGNNGDTPGSSPPVRFTLSSAVEPSSLKEPLLPSVLDALAHSHSRGETFRVEGTNVVRVPFGVRKSRRSRPERPDRWATLVLPFQSSGGPTPPQAA